MTGADRIAGTLIVLLAAAGVVSAAKPAAPCCFTNPAYAGVCSVQPKGAETCDDILAYLNNPSSAGKTYCHNTTVRGGWASADCKPHK